MEVSKSKLLKALETVKPGLANKEMIEQSTSFCFLNGNVVTYNDEISIACPVEGLDLTGAINASELHSFISKGTSDTIEMEVSKTEILLRCGKAKAGLALHAKIVLPIEEIGEIQKWKPLPDDFCAGLNFVMGACSQDMSKPVLTCVHINKGVLEGTDNYRVSNYTLKTAVRLPAILLPALICAKVVKMFPVEVSQGVGWVHFRTLEKAVISCRIFEDSFPDTTKVLDVVGTAVTFPASLIGILDRAGVFSKRDYSLDETVHILIEKKRIQVKSTSASGWFEEKDRIDFNGDSIEFAITPYLLKDILRQTSKGIIGDTGLMFVGENWKYITMVKG